MRFARLETPEQWQWFKTRTHVIACEDSQGLLMLDEDGGVLAGAVFDSFSPDG